MSSTAVPAVSAKGIPSTLPSRQDLPVKIPVCEMSPGHTMNMGR
jgi:hypothetical protein